MNNIVVLGEGAWGTAVATVLAHNGHDVTLWCHHPEVAQQIQVSHTNCRYFSGVPLSPRITATSNMAHALSSAEIIFVAIPVQYIRAVLQLAQPWYRASQLWVSLSKGMEQDTLLLPLDIIQQLFGASAKTVVFSGPTFAREVVAQVPTIGVLASDDAEALNVVRQLCQNSWLAFSSTDDVIGVQVCGAVKNLIALGIGMLEGAGYGQNTKAFFLTHGLRDIAILNQFLGGSRDTVYGLAGVGDLMLTAYGNLSKNLTVGKLVGAGTPLAQVLTTMDFVPEGINTVQAIAQLQAKNQLTLPICSAVYKVLYEQQTVTSMITVLMKSER